MPHPHTHKLASLYFSVSCLKQGIPFIMNVFSASGFGMLVMAGFLALAAVAQLNDPDPLVWIAAYGFPAVLTLWAWATDLGKWLWSVLCTTVLMAVSVFAVSVVYPTVRDGNISNILNSEEGRETAGLIIVISWLLILLMFQRAIWFDCGVLAFAVVPPSAWIAYKFYIQQTLSLPQHCEGLI